jgi:hypothetical protein
MTKLPPDASPTGKEHDMFLCRLHFSYKLNNPAFRGYSTYPADPSNKENMQLLYDLHDKSKP